jgi:hypothetical protein
MKTHTRFDAGRKRYYRGEARQKFHINDRVDADFPDPDLLTRVKMAQSGAPTQRSVRCKVEMRAGRSIFC